jgi:4-carboxymuconolactone decarboxylase
MNAERHPWLDGRFPQVDTLNDTLRIWTFLAGHTASGDLQAVGRDWRWVPATDHLGGVEIILQTHLFAGYPRTLNALRVVHALGVAECAAREAPAAPGDPWDEAAWKPAGDALCRRVYGGVYDKLRAQVKRLHPDLDNWMVHTGYGRVLSRPGPSARERELCIVAVLAGQDVAPQLRSHLLGAMNAGATSAECRAILGQTEAVWGPRAQAQVDRVWGALGVG